MACEDCGEHDGHYEFCRHFVTAEQHRIAELEAQLKTVQDGRAADNSKWLEQLEEERTNQRVLVEALEGYENSMYANYREGCCCAGCVAHRKGKQALAQVKGESSD